MLDENALRNAYDLIRGRELPGLPEIVIQVGKEVARPKPDLGAVAGLINKDIRMSGLVLKMINSAYYKRRVEIQSIAQATVLLGLDNIKNLVVAAAFKQAMVTDNDDYRAVVENSHSVGLCAAGIAALVDGLSAEEAYLAGLFHDAGVILMAGADPGYFDTYSNWQQDPIGITDAETEQYGTHHGIVSYILARHWKLPEIVCLAISQHHVADCSHIEDSRLRAYVAALKLANYLVNRVIADKDSDVRWVRYRDSALRELMLDQRDWAGEANALACR